MSVRQAASKYLRDTFSAERASKPLLPLRSDDLLRYIIGHSSVDEKPLLRLPDLPAFEEALKELAADWEHGLINIEYDGQRVRVMGVVLHQRKRKRDEDGEQSM